jgi:hypothetical protein
MPDRAEAAEGIATANTDKMNPLDRLTGDVKMT